MSLTSVVAKPQLSPLFTRGFKPCVSLYAALAITSFTGGFTSQAHAWEFEAREYYLTTSNTWQWGKPVTQTAYRYADVRVNQHAWVTELAGEHVWGRVIGRLTFGVGAITGGELTHKSANSLFEKSYSDTRGSLMYGAVEGGYRFIDAPRFQLDGLVGMKYRADHVEGRGATGHTLGTLTAFNQQYGTDTHTATEDSEWFAPTISLRAKYHILPEKLSVFGSVSFIPWTWTSFEEERPVRNNGTHYNLQKRATNGEATGGWGLDSLLGLEYRITPNLVLKLGFTYGLMHSGTGYFHFNPSTPDCRQPGCKPVVFDFRSKSQSWGPFFGVSYRW